VLQGVINVGSAPSSCDCNKKLKKINSAFSFTSPNLPFRASSLGFKASFIDLSGRIYSGDRILATIYILNGRL